MPYYSYTAIGPDGRLESGSMEGSDLATVHDGLADSGLHIVSLKEVNPYLRAITKALHARSITRPQIVEFSLNLSVMLRAGIPIITSLSDMSVSLENKYFKETIINVKNSVEYGSSFSDALKSHPEVFPDILVRLSKIAEETGRLDQSLDEVGRHLQRMEDLAASIKRALIYPIFALVVSIGSLLFWLMYVLPKITSVFISMGIPLPIVTRILIAASDFTRNYWYVIFLTPVVIYGIIKALQQNKETRYWVDLVKIKIPIFKEIIFNRVLALVLEELRILTASGITMDRSFEMISEGIGNEVFEKAMSEAREDIIAGSRISDALRKFSVFPPLVTRMVDIGESSGSLDEQFDFLATYYLKVLDDMSQKLGKMIEPIIIAFLGALFALIIVGLLLPVYDIVSNVR